MECVAPGRFRESHGEDDAEVGFAAGHASVSFVDLGEWELFDHGADAGKLGAHIYIDSSATNSVAELQKLGGAQVILATAPSGKAMSELIPGLAPRGKFLVIGASGDPLQVQTGLMIGGSKTIQGWASGVATDSEDTLRFAELSGVRPMIEKFPLAKVNEAYARMTSGKAQFRVVLTM